MEGQAKRAGLIDRASGIILRPRQTWAAIARESTPSRQVFTGYVTILASVNPVCSAIGRLVFGERMLGAVYRAPTIGVLIEAVVGYGLALGSVWILALLIEQLAPPFGAVKDRAAAFRIAAYSSTAGWLAGVVHLVPAIESLALIGQIYTLVLLYFGVKILLQPRGRTTGYVALVVVSYVVLMMLAISLTKLLGAFI
jgi:hypothetical protein